MLFPFVKTAAFGLTALWQHSETTITHATTGMPVPYASVGVLGKPIGTVADAGGHVALGALAAAAPTDTVVVSCLGFASRKLLARELPQHPVLQLEPAAQALRGVTVRATGWKRRRIGHEGSFSFTHYNFHTHQDDASPAVKLGTVLYVPAGSVLEDAHFYVGWSHFRDVRLRLNVRALTPNDQPGPSLLTQDVQVALPNEARGWQHLDLRAYDVQVGPHSRVAVTLEWLQGTPDSQRDWYNLTIPAPLTPWHRMVFRDKPEDRWHTYRASLSLYVTALSPRG